MNTQELSERVAELTIELDSIKRGHQLERHMARDRWNVTVILMCGMIAAAFIMGCML